MIDELPVRLANKISVSSDGCWLWTGCINWGGYGLSSVGSLRSSARGRLAGAHRIVYEVAVGLIPDGMTLDHTCHDSTVCTAGVACMHRRCVNPRHLEPVTIRTNTLRGGSRSAVNARKTRCPRGHGYTQDNTYVSPAGERSCRQCVRDRRAGRTPEQVAEERRKGRERARLRATRVDLAAYQRERREARRLNATA